MSCEFLKIPENKSHKKKKLIHTDQGTKEIKIDRSHSYDIVTLIVFKNYKIAIRQL